MNPTGPLEVKVAAFKLIARDALRMNMISPRLSAIATLENRITDITKSKNEVNHSILVNNYEISKLDTGHPDYEAMKAEKNEIVTRATETLKGYDESITNIQKDIDEQKAGIVKIENGETKVSLDDLNQFVERLVKEDAFKQVNQ